MKKQILQSGDEDYHDHRGDFRTCPTCDFKQETKEWERAAHTLVIEPKQWKSGSVAIVTECPKCFKDSWVHEPMDSFEYSDFPEAWKKAVDKREKEVKLQALREWAVGLCGRCKHLKEGHISHTTHRACIAGFGPVSTKCNKFEPCK